MKSACDRYSECRYFISERGRMRFKWFVVGAAAGAAVSYFCLLAALLHWFFPVPLKQTEGFRFNVGRVHYEVIVIGIEKEKK